jgi:hypothetical protein
MVAPNEVKIRVRSNALDLVEFTVEKMQQVTGLNPASIHTELTRMKRAGYLTSSPLPGARRGRGAPPHLYRLTDDKDKLDELASSVEAFYQPPGPARAQPTSLHYQAACTLIDQLERDQAPIIERETAVTRATYYLDMAAADEGITVEGDEKTEIVAAYLTLLRARLAIVQKHWSEAETYLAEARSTFTTHQVDDGMGQADTLANALAVEKVMMDAPDTPSLFQRLLESLRSQGGHVPVLTLCRLLERAQTIAVADHKDITIQTLSRTLEMMAQKSLAETAAAESRQEWASETSRQREMTRQLNPTGTEGRAEVIDFQRERRLRQQE